MMIFALTVIAAVLTGMPMVIIVLVSVASRLEDRDWTVAWPPPSTTRAFARRIVGFHSEGIEWLLYAGRGRGEQYPANAKRPHPRKTAA